MHPSSRNVHVDPVPVLLELRPSCQSPPLAASGVTFVWAGEPWGAMGSDGEPWGAMGSQSSGGNRRLRHPPARWQPCGDAQASLFAISAPFSPKVSERRGSTPFHSSLRYLDLFSASSSDFASDLTSEVLTSLRFMCHCGVPMAWNRRTIRLKAIDLPLTKCLNASSEASWRRDEDADAPLAVGGSPIEQPAATWRYPLLN